MTQTPCPARAHPALSWEHRKEYVDGGLSGDDPHRPELKRLRADVRPGDVVLVYNKSRLYRDSTRRVQFARDLGDEGVTIYAAATKDQIKVGTATEQLIATVDGFADQAFLETGRLNGDILCGG